MSAKNRAQEASKRGTSLPHNYEMYRFKIPKCVLSLTPPAKQAQLEEIDQLLKRKASQLSASLTPTSSREFLTTKRQCLDLEEQKFILLYNGLREAFEKGDLKKDDYQILVKECFEQRAKVTQESVTVARAGARIVQKLSQEELLKEPDMTAAYANLLSMIYKSVERPAGYEVRDQHKHTAWKEDIRYHYANYHPDDDELLWCPIMQRYAGSDCRIVAHIVPHSLGFCNVGILFGEPDNGIDLIWSRQNGIAITSQLEKQFDKGDFILIPDSSEISKPQEYRFVLMNEKLRAYPVGDSDIKYGQLERRLVWKNDERPGARFLYFHFVSALLRYQKFEKSGWAESFLNQRTGTIWASPGPYLKRSVLRKLGEYLGDVETEQKFSLGTFDSLEGQSSVTDIDEELAAKDIGSLDIENYQWAIASGS
ncbi:hypothetical protein MMC06_004168 [Schaereria dolodes]|nr:hypothetical protein [Schaereria dolodes]